MRFRQGAVSAVVAMAVNAAVALDASAQVRCSDTTQPEAAIAGCTQDIQSGRLSSENMAIAYANRGLHYVILKDSNSAVADCSTSLRYNPSQASAYVCLGSASDMQGDYETAISNYDRALELNPQFAAAFAGRGVAKANNGDLTGARGDFEEAVRLSPDDEEYQSQLAAVEKAIEDSNRSAPLVPKDKTTIIGLATLGALVWLFPLWRLIARAGKSRWQFLFLLIPLIGIIYLWFLAFSRWPALADNRAA